MKDKKDQSDWFPAAKSNIQLQNKDRSLRGPEFQVHQD